MTDCLNGIGSADLQRPGLGTTADPKIRVEYLPVMYAEAGIYHHKDYDHQIYVSGSHEDDAGTEIVEFHVIGCENQPLGMTINKFREEYVIKAS